MTGLAELEAAFAAGNLVDLAKRFETGRLSAADIIRIIACGLRGAGESVSEAAFAAPGQSRSISPSPCPAGIAGAPASRPRHHPETIDMKGYRTLAWSLLRSPPPSVIETFDWLILIPERHAGPAMLAVALVTAWLRVVTTTPVFAARTGGSR